jgi:hypothetical protein
LILTSLNLTRSVCKLSNLQCSSSSSPQRKFTMHWCFDFISQMPNWVGLNFGQNINANIMLLHKKFQKNPHHHSKVMIKYLEDSATGNEFAAKFTTPVYQFAALIQTRFSCFEETVRMSKDLIPENLLKIGSENNEIP